MKLLLLSLCLSALFLVDALAQKPLKVVEVGQDHFEADFPTGGQIRMEVFANRHSDPQPHVYKWQNRAMSHLTHRSHYLYRPKPIVTRRLPEVRSGMEGTCWTSRRVPSPKTLTTWLLNNS
jgi:hypothetical protein